MTLQKQEALLAVRKPFFAAEVARWVRIFLQNKAFTSLVSSSSSYPGLVSQLTAFQSHEKCSKISLFPFTFYISMGTGHNKWATGFILAKTLLLQNILNRAAFEAGTPHRDLMNLSTERNEARS